MHKFVRSANREKRALVIAILSLIQGCDPSGSVEPPHSDATTPPKTPVEVHPDAATPPKSPIEVLPDATTPPKSPIKLHYADAATPPKTPIKLHYTDAATPPQKGGIAVLISVDWEGFRLNANDLEAMERFRRQNKKIPFVQFLNAAYYTKFNADPLAVTAAIKRVLLPIDELGLHIHGWRSLFEAAGVKYRNTPRYDNVVSHATEDHTVDVGETVQISAYSQEELERVIAFSVTTLEAHGFGRAKSFRADRVGAPSRGASHRTVLVLFTYGSSGPRVFTLAASRFTTSYYPSASVSCTGAAMYRASVVHFSSSDMSPRLAKYALRSPRSTAGVCANAHSDLWPL